MGFNLKTTNIHSQALRAATPIIILLYVQISFSFQPLHKRKDAYLKGEALLKKLLHVKKFQNLWEKKYKKG